MSFFSFGAYVEGRSFKVLDERKVRGSSGIMLLLGIIAFIYGFILRDFIVIPYISGILALSFLIAIIVNPRFSPTMILASLMTWKQSPMYIGAIQKRFAWTLGFLLSTGIFILSLFLLNDESYFDPVCLLCLICLLFLYLESVFGICVGCQLYHLSIRMKILPKPNEKPNCMGDSCEV